MVSKTSILTQKILLTIIFVISGIVMLGWILEIPTMVSFIDDSATMKFNTAFLLFLVTMCALVNEETGTAVKWSANLILLFVFAISLISHIEYFLQTNINVDNLFIIDSLSPNISGRMSPATSMSFMLISFGQFFRNTSSTKLNQLCNALLFIVFSIALASFISFFLFIPVKNKMLFFKTMSLPTTLAFLALSFLMILKKPNNFIKEILNTNKIGSKLFWKFSPIIIFIPILVSYVLLYFSGNIFVNIDFGIALSTNIFILFSLIHLTYLSHKLNKSEKERIILEQKITILKENEIRRSLLKETHHRVKNNFQIINSILGLQSNQSKNMELKIILSDCQNRIQTIAALHESIYVNGNFEVVKLKNFLSGIVSKLVQIHMHDYKVKVDIDIPDIDMNMESAMPLGLILNEIVTNSLKHAFIPSDEKIITIQLKVYNSNEFKLIIGDNGKGCKNMANELLHPTSMGSELIAVFTDQLEGDISVENKNGLVYYLFFKINNFKLKIA